MTKEESKQKGWLSTLTRKEKDDWKFYNSKGLVEKVEDSGFAISTRTISIEEFKEFYKKEYNEYKKNS